MKASIIISSHDRLPLFRRTLWAIATRPPSVPFEVVVCDDGSTEDVLGELRKYSSRFPWKFVRFDAAAFEARTGLRKFLNNPAATNNIAFRHSSGEVVFQQGNEVIPWAGCYDRLVRAAQSLWSADPGPGTPLTHPDRPHWMVMSTTFDLPQEELDAVDAFGANLTDAAVRRCERWPLQSRAYRSDVTNYVSLAPRALWEALGGYDERYYAGISAEDSDFVRRARALPGFTQVVADDAVSLHQYHGGKTRYYDPPRHVVTRERWEEGVAINHAVYHAWDGRAGNPQKWPWGEWGVGEVVTSAGGAG